MQLPEALKTGLDTLAAAATLSWSILGSLADMAFDLLSGRQLPEPDLKSVAEAPEPGAICRIRTPKPIPRTSRTTLRRDQVA
jgi:hypothetical protein